MKQHAVLVFIVVALLTAGARMEPCSVCVAPIQCCQDTRYGYQCYDPLVSACVVGTNLTAICPLNHKICNNYCYDPTTSACVTTDSGREISCNVGNKACSELCYDPQYHSCIQTSDSQKILVNVGTKLCGDSTVYNPLYDKCVTVTVPPTSAPQATSTKSPSIAPQETSSTPTTTAVTSVNPTTAAPITTRTPYVPGSQDMLVDNAGSTLQLGLYITTVLLCIFM
jgi:hypothetical protein